MPQYVDFIQRIGASKDSLLPKRPPAYDLRTNWQNITVLSAEDNKS